MHEPVQKLNLEADITPRPPSSSSLSSSSSKVVPSAGDHHPPPQPPPNSVRNNQYKMTVKNQNAAALNSAIEVIQNLSNTYSIPERIRSAQLAMKLSPGSQNSYAISKILFDFSQNNIHYMASRSMVKDLLGFLAICGSKPLIRYSNSVLYTLGSLRSITASWKTSVNIDYEDLCDEILEYVSLVMEVVLNQKLPKTADNSKSSPKTHEILENQAELTKNLEKILIQATGLIRNTTDKLSNVIDQFKYHDTFTSLFVTLRRYYKNYNIILNITRIFSSLEMEKLLKNEPDLENYFNFLVFSLVEHSENSGSDLQSLNGHGGIDQLKNDHFVTKVLYLLGNLAEYWRGF